ncbi:transport and Golgi organization protein 6 homolog isoform X1 [Heterodontus francisci]|uniref:transport and Golgi organization protein 6 homolog isoform X1 n=1 Tax=Heterodontus francisci TaxID=7792 RepID=UPI00355BB08A
MAVPLWRLTEALRELIVPGEACVLTAQTSREDVLLRTLSHNRSVLEQKLWQDPDRATLQRLRERMMSQLAWSVKSDDAVWSFVTEALVLLLCLKQAMIELLAQFTPPKPNPKTPECAPALPPDTLSISQQKTVQSALQFIVTLGICPYLLPGVGTPLSRRSDFAATVEKMVCRMASPSRMWRLHTVTLVLLDIAQHPSLESLILTRHLGDLLASLCQLGYSPNKCQSSVSEEGSQQNRETPKVLTDAEQQSCREALQNLLDRVYQPIVIKELLILQGGTKQVACAGAGKVRTLSHAPAWLRHLCGQLLSERLMKPSGVQAVVRGIVEGAGAGIAGGQNAEAAAADWRKCDTVARVLASCPQQCLSVEDYYRQVCPQVLELFHIRDKLTARQFQRVATTTLLSMVKEQPELTDSYLLRPLLAPLINCLGTGETAERSGQVGTVIVGELELTRCVEDVYKVCVVGNDPSSRLLESLKIVIPAIFSLYCFTKRGVSHLRSACQEILLWFLQKSEPPVAMLVLKEFAGLARSIPVPHPLYHFTAGSEGGVKLSVKAAVSDEDEALYEKMSSEQWLTECLAHLLSNLQESSLAGDFFIECLKGLTCLAGETDGRPALSHADGLPEFEQQEQQLVTLQLVAILCERFGHFVLSNTAHVIEFVIATLERSCMNLTLRTEETVEAQTLSMGMGLIAAMLGGAVQLTSADFDAMKPMLPRLEQIAALHPDPVIQELASDLRITVATHGAFSTEMVAVAAHSAMGNQNKHDDKSTEPSQTKEADAVTDSHRHSPTSCRAGGTDRKNKASSGNSPSNFHQVLQAAFDPEIPTRAAALRTVTQMVQQRNPAALSNQEKVLSVFMENLKHEDSFVYLSAIQGLSVLSDIYPARILPRLLEEYQMSPQGAEKTRCVETRMKMGEVLMRSTRALGEIASHYRDPLIRAFLMGTRDSDGTLRASSLSNLGELCQRLDFALGSVIHEVTACLAAIVKTDREPEVRRAAVHVITLLLRGLGEKTLQVMGDALRDLYRLLKYVIQADEDEVVVLHAQLSLEELDHIVRTFLFPEEKLQKKIVILP